VVIIWDEGPAEIRRNDPGHMSVVLHGQKLAGGFGLTRTGERRWVLVKVRDEFALPGSDITADRPESVRTGRRWEDLVRRESSATTSGADDGGELLPEH
jgi:hypothetical protein